MERLTFNARSADGSRRTAPPVVAARGGADAPARRWVVEYPRALGSGTTTAVKAGVSRVKRRVSALRERYDADYLWMLAFTALLFFRPQDQFPPLAALHLAELTAIAGLGAMAMRRMGSGQTIVTITPEVIGVIVLGGIIVMTLPFSIWPGGSLKVFSDIYVKIILIFALMITTITTPKRLRQMTWVMMIASGYIAGRGVFDYLRGVNLVEGDRLRGAIGGMFQNPNDLALNLVTFLAPTLFIVIQDRKTTRRLFAAGLAALMLAAIVATKSRGGFLGLGAMCLVIAYYMLRVKPGMIFAGIVAVLLAMPMMPQSFWERMDSITNAETDPTGSRAARIRLIEQAVTVFSDNPITGIGAGQFVNYDGPDALERNRATHDVWLQVAAELGIFGLFTFAFLVFRSYKSCFMTMRALRTPKKKAGKARGPAAPLRPRALDRTAFRSTKTKAAAAPSAVQPLTEEEARIVEINAKGMLAAMVGWTVCSLFASVAFNWTFYYVFALAVAGREIALSRRRAVEAVDASAQPVVGVPRLAASRA